VVAEIFPLKTQGDAKQLPAYRSNSNPSRSLTASFRFCRVPKYRSVVRPPDSRHDFAQSSSSVAFLPPFTSAKSLNLCHVMSAVPGVKTRQLWQSHQATRRVYKTSAPTRFVQSAPRR